MKKTTFKSGLSTLTLACLCTLAQAQALKPAAFGLADAVQKAISNNPEVTVRLHALQAAGHETDVARGGFYPTLDLSANLGRDSNRITSQTPESLSSTRSGIALTANQVLWDGESTRKEVERLGHARLTRYFEFLSATEDTALETARAYIDVQRYRKLVSLAEDNYVQHKYASDQLQTKFKAGVGRGVDSEQANARMALADSNLTTEVANLHDVAARFLRVVGEAPSPRLPATSGLDKNLAAANNDTVQQALAHNASISATVENLRSVEAQASGKQSVYQPKLEARLRSGVGNNLDGVTNQKRDTTGQLLLNWNLYNGGSDQARVHQYTDLINQAADQRDKACRDVRQTAAVAYNDIQKLKDQLAALDRNVLAIEKARDAYRQQFDIGQRSLLDLLNAENELYTAKRAYANAESDLQLAYARTQAAKNTLVSSLGLAQDEGSANLVKDWQANSDAAQRCPVISVEPPAVNRQDLADRAQKLAGPAIPAPEVAAPVIAPVVETPPPAASDEVAMAETVAQRLRDWAAAWMAKDTGKYLSFYAKDFAPARVSSAKWVAERRRLVTKPGEIDVKLDNINATPQGDLVVTSFDQTYTSANFKDKTAKTLSWKRVGGQWVIVKESNR